LLETPQMPANRANIASEGLRHLCLASMPVLDQIDHRVRLSQTVAHAIVEQGQPAHAYYSPAALLAKATTAIDCDGCRLGATYCRE
jgi:hypothetical protein